MMDFHPALIFIVIVIISAALLMVVAVFGIKEKSYEEALAEQRQHNNALLSNHTKVKPKEKKLKKAGKKMREKQGEVAVEPETIEESENVESGESLHSIQNPQKLHVAFKESSIEESPIMYKKRVKREKAKPILIHKDVENPVVNDVIDVLPANHFEQNHPKDELELLLLHGKEELPSKQDSPKGKSKAKQINVEQESNKDKINKSKHQQVSIEESIKDKNKSKVTNIDVDVKEKIVKVKTILEVEFQKNQKKHKPNENVIPAVQLIAEKEEPPVEIVNVAAQSNGYTSNSSSISKEKKKKKNEISTLQQMTSNKASGINLSILIDVVRKAELSRSEVQILIDLLLNKQHEAPEILDEWSEGKADPVQKLKKQLSEKEKALIEEQEALTSAQGKLREVRAEQIAERSQLQQRIRGLEEAFQAKQLELQTTNNRCHGQTQKLQQMQVQLNEEMMTVRKLRDDHGALQMQRQQFELRLAQTQEAEGTIVQLRNELQELQNRNNQLAIELHSLNDQNIATKEHQQSMIMQLQHQLAHLKGEIDQKDEINLQLEESRRDLEHRLGLTHRQDNEFKVEISQLSITCQQQAEELKNAEFGRTQALDEIRNIQKQKEDAESSLITIRQELQHVLDAKTQLENSKQNNMLEANQEELLNLQHQLAFVQSQLKNTESKYASELSVSDRKINHLQIELEEQRNKNNELRKKNWKVIEALNVAESRIKSTFSPSKQEIVNLDGITTKIRLEEQQCHRKFLQRLFPSIPISEILSNEHWLVDVEKTVQEYMDNLKRVKSLEQPLEVAKLQAEVQNYKAIIDDTEGILNKLQTHIEQEEIHWRSELKAKENEIQVLKDLHLTQLQKKVIDLELQLQLEQDAKLKLSEECQILKNENMQHSNFTIMEKLSEVQNHSAINGPSLTSEENGN